MENIGARRTLDNYLYNSRIIQGGPLFETIKAKSKTGVIRDAYMVLSKIETVKEDIGIFSVTDSSETSSSEDEEQNWAPETPWEWYLHNKEHVSQEEWVKRGTKYAKQMCDCVF